MTGAKNLIEMKYKLFHSGLPDKGIIIIFSAQTVNKMQVIHFIPLILLIVAIGNIEAKPQSGAAGM